MSSHIFGVLLALSSALIYGSADFFGGRATRKFSPFYVLSIAAMIGVFPMTLVGFLRGETILTGYDLWIASMAGIAGLFGLALLYSGLANGSTAIVSPLSGVSAALIPVFYNSMTNTLPSNRQLVGFFIAIVGIWLTTFRSGNQLEFESNKLQMLAIGLTSGILFGIFFILIAQISPTTTFYSLAVSKAATFIVSFGLFLWLRRGFVKFQVDKYIILTGLFDPFANALYVLATRFTRLDIAVILSSLYPAGTILLAKFLMDENISRKQWAGITLCMVSIGLISS